MDSATELIDRLGADTLLQDEVSLSNRRQRTSWRYRSSNSIRCGNEIDPSLTAGASFVVSGSFCLRLCLLACALLAFLACVPHVLLAFAPSPDDAAPFLRVSAAVPPCAFAWPPYTFCLLNRRRKALLREEAQTDLVPFLDCTHLRVLVLDRLHLALTTWRTPLLLLFPTSPWAIGNSPRDRSAMIYRRAKNIVHLKRERKM